MAKRNKSKKLFKSNLKLEALEQRQLLAGITGSGTELTPGGAGANNFITASNGNHYDQVLLTGTSVSVTNDVGNITRVSFLDLQGDIVQAEFGGAGTLTISLDPTTAVAGVQPTKYNQTVTGGYEQGLASFSIQGSDSTTNFTVFSVGASTAFAGNTLFDSTHTGGNNTADVQRITVVANPANPNGSTFGGIRAGNAIFGAASGVVGISAANVQVQDVVTVGDIQASGTAAPTLVFGTASQFGQITVAGGGLVEANGASINNAGSYKFGLVLAAGQNSAGTAIAAQPTPAGLSFIGDNPIAAQVKTFTLTAGVDTIVGSSGNDAINGQIGSTGTPTLTPLDTIDGGLGTDSLSINDVTGSTNLPIGISIKNVETLNLGAAGGVGASAVSPFDTSGSTITGLTTVNILASAGSDFIKAGTGQAVTVFDTAGTVNLVGGSTQTVNTAGGVVLSKATDAITATDTAQGTAVSSINDGTTVNLTNTATGVGPITTGTITIGATTKPTGAVTIKQNLNTDATFTNTVTGGLITVNGGTTVSVTESLTGTLKTNVASSSNMSGVESAVTVNGANGITTSVTVNQTPKINSDKTIAAIPAATEVDTVVFSTIPAGQSVKLDGLTIAGPLSAQDAARAFANLQNGALSSWTSGGVTGASSDTVVFTATGAGGSTTASDNKISLGGNNLVETVKFADLATTSSTTFKSITILGLKYTAPSGAAVPAATVAAAFQSHGYSNVTETSLGAGVVWSSGVATGDTVVFSAQTDGISDNYFSVSDATTTPSLSSPAVVTVTATVPGLKATGNNNGRLGASAGVVAIAGDAGVTSNSITTVALSNYGDSTIKSDVLTNLTLTNTGSGSKDVSGSTGTLGITNGSATSLDLTLNGGGQGKLGTITAPIYTTIKVHTTGSDVSTSIVNTTTTTLTVDGTKKFTIDGSTSTLSLAGLQTVTVSGGASFSAVSSSNQGISLASTLTDINASGTTGSVSVAINPTTTTYEGGSGADSVIIAAVPTKAISGGAGTDTLTLNAAGGGTFGIPSSNTNISGFETLAVGSQGSGAYDATGFTDLRRSSDLGDVTFSNVAAGTTLTFTDDASNNTTYTLKTDTSADALTINVNGAAKTVTAGDVETVTIANASNDSSITLAAAKATTVTITGGKKLNLDASSNAVLSLVDGSAATASLTIKSGGVVAATIRGGTAADTLTAGGGSTGTTADILIGNAGSDTLVANKGLDTLTGGSDNDTFVVAIAPNNLNAYSTITDASVGDVVRLANKGNEIFATSKPPLQNTASFEAFANTIINNGGDASANGQLGWFQYNGDTYIVESMHNAVTTKDFQDGVDLIVKLTGLVDLSGAALVQNGNSPEIVIR